MVEIFSAGYIESMRKDQADTGPEGKIEHGRRLSSLRLRAGLTQSDIAEKIAVSRQHISNIETGATSPTLQLLEHYLETCGDDSGRRHKGSRLFHDIYAGVVECTDPTNSSVRSAQDGLEVLSSALFSRHHDEKSRPAKPSRWKLEKCLFFSTLCCDIPDR